MNQSDAAVALSLADQVGASIGSNITNPTPLDRLISLTYAGYKVQRDFFTFGLKLAVVQGGVAQGNVIIAADSDFVLLQQAVHANINNAGQTYQTEVLPLVTVMLTDTSSGRQLLDVDQPISNLFGSARQPFVLPVPRLIPAKTVLQVKVTNFDAANGYNLNFSFIGAKVFNLGPM